MLICTQMTFRFGDLFMQTITWADFAKVELRVGTIIEVQDFTEARKPTYKLLIDFGPDIGTKKIECSDHGALQKRGPCLRSSAASTDLLYE
jgi:tRNA-binding EMAP/Myf-like protein